MSENDEVEGKRWSKDWDDDVVMRPTVEGRGRTGGVLQMCVMGGRTVGVLGLDSEGGGNGKGGEKGEGEGGGGRVRDEVMVPFAIIAAVRREVHVRNEGRRFDCISW